MVCLGRCLISSAMATALVLLAAPNPAQAAALEFQLTFSPKVSQKAFTGRVYIMLSRQPSTGLRSGPNWFSPEPLFARDVSDWKPDQPLVLGTDLLGYPYSAGGLPAAEYHIQAVMDFDRGAMSFSTAAGNGYSQPCKRDWRRRAAAGSSCVSIRFTPKNRSSPPSASSWSISRASC